MRAKTVLFGLLLVAQVVADHVTLFPSGWDYSSGPLGPSNWGTTFPQCSAGNLQSPIDIDRALVTVNEQLQDLVVQYAQRGYSFNQSAGLLQFLPEAGTVSTLGYNGQTWNLTALRFHTPSEHTLNGVRFPAEIEFVHSRSNGDALSLSLLVNLGGGDNANWPVTFPLPSGVQMFNPATLLPEDLSYLTYEGSESVPPCHQITQRVIVWRPITISAMQYQLFFQGVQANQQSNRPVQAANARALHFHHASPGSVTQVSTCHAISEFNIEREGWTEFSASELMISNLTHAPGKFLTGRPIPGSNAIPWSFTGPLGFRGNLSHLATGVLRFWLRPKANTIRKTISGISSDVTFIGQNAELVAVLPSLPSATFFTEYVFRFDDLSGNEGAFRIRPIGDKSTGAVPTAQQVREVLEYVKCMTIRGTYNLQEVHSTDLDQVFLCDGDSLVVPCPGAAGDMRDQCSRRGVCIAGQCHCNFGWKGADCSQKDKCAVGTFPLPESVQFWPGFAALP